MEMTMVGLALVMIGVIILSTTTNQIEGQAEFGEKVLKEGVKSVEEDNLIAETATKRKADKLNKVSISIISLVVSGMRQENRSRNGSS